MFAWSGDTDGRLACWGKNQHGQARSPTSQQVVTPFLNDTALQFYDVALGRDHACGFTGEGGGYCWGSSLNGILGNEIIAGIPSPAPSRLIWDQ